MELTITLGILIGLLAFICETIDASLGMLYGTILSPVLIIIGFNPAVVVPAILISQALGGFLASITHHQFKNAELLPKKMSLKREDYSRDLKTAFVVIFLGIIATIFGALAAIKISKEILTVYIGLLVLVMGLILVTGKKFRFSWKKIMGLGILSAFNKSVSGGGFGPVLTSGQIISGAAIKNSVAVTTFAEAPICITGFIIYWATKGIENWPLVGILIISAGLGGIIGPYFTKYLSSKKWIIRFLGGLVIVLGIWTLLKILKT